MPAVPGLPCSKSKLGCSAVFEHEQCGAWASIKRVVRRSASVDKPQLLATFLPNFFSSSSSLFFLPCLHNSPLHNINGRQNDDMNWCVLGRLASIVIKWLQPFPDSDNCLELGHYLVPQTDEDARVHIFSKNTKYTEVIHRRSVYFLKLDTEFIHTPTPLWSPRAETKPRLLTDDT